MIHSGLIAVAVTLSITVTRETATTRPPRSSFSSASKYSLQCPISVLTFPCHSKGTKKAQTPNAEGITKREMFLAVLGNRSTSLFVNYIRIIRHDKQKKFIIIFKIYPKTKYRSQYRRDRQIKAAASFGSGLCQPPRYARSTPPASTEPI